MTTFQKTKYQLNIKVSTTNTDINAFYRNKYGNTDDKTQNNHAGDSGIDLYNLTLCDIKQFQVGTIDFQIKCEMINIETNTYSSYYLVPRSSLANTDFQLANSIGIIDAGYRGNLKAKVRNFSTDSNNTFQSGSFFQIIAPDLQPIRVCVIDELNELSQTTRNDGGFGSTNKTN